MCTTDNSDSRWQHSLLLLDLKGLLFYHLNERQRGWIAILFRNSYVIIVQPEYQLIFGREMADKIPSPSFSATGAFLYGEGLCLWNIYYIKKKTQHVFK